MSGWHGVPLPPPTTSSSHLNSSTSTQPSGMIALLLFLLKQSDSTSSLLTYAQYQYPAAGRMWESAGLFSPYSIPPVITRLHRQHTPLYNQYNTHLTQVMPWLMRSSSCQVAIDFSQVLSPSSFLVGGEKKHHQSGELLHVYYEPRWWLFKNPSLPADLSHWCKWRPGLGALTI